MVGPPDGGLNHHTGTRREDGEEGTPQDGAKPKPPARPYKKTETDVLRVRIATMKKKLSILESRR